MSIKKIKPTVKGAIPIKNAGTKLSFIQRLMITGGKLFSVEASFLDQIIIGDIEKKTKFTQKEIVDFKIKHVGHGIEGIPALSTTDFFIVYSKAEKDLFKKVLSEIKNQNRPIHKECMSLFEVFGVALK